MKQDKDWMEVMRSSLRDAEMSPPVDGWARLEQSLGVDTPRIVLRRPNIIRVVAAAAAIMVCVATGGYLWYADFGFSLNGKVISKSADGGATLFNPTTGDLPASVDALATNGATEVSAASAVEPLLSLAAAPQKSKGQITARRVVAADAAHLSPSYSAPIASEISVAEVSDGSATDVQPDHASQSVDSSPTTRTVTAQRAKQQQTKSTGALFSVNEQVVAYRTPRKQMSMSMFAAGGFGGRSAGNPGASVRRLFSDTESRGGLSPIPALLTVDYDQSSFRHHQPFSFGVTFRKDLRYGLALESGVNYTLLLSSVTMPMATKDFSQKLHFIGIPLRLNWRFLERRDFSLYIGAGGMVEKCVSAQFGSMPVDEPRMQWSVAGVVGAEYRLGGRTGLYFEPEVSHYFTKTELRTVRTDTPLTFTLRLGVRFSF